MQINQQICRKMEELDKIEENSSDIDKVQSVKTFTFLSQSKYS